MNDLSNIKAGDKVILRGLDHDEVRTVTRITPKGFIVIEHGWGRMTFNTNGHERSRDAWHAKWIEPCTPEDAERLTAQKKDREDRARLFARLQKQGWKGLSTDQLQRIVAILDETTQPTKDEARTLGAEVC